MKKGIIQVIIVIAMICSFIVFIQLNASPQSLPANNQSNKPTYYSLASIMKVFSQHHIKITPTNEEKSTSYDLNQVPPQIFMINADTKRMLFIYVFDSVTDRQKAEEPYKQEYKNIFPSDFFPLRIYETWNILILETIKQPVKLAEFKDIKQTELDQIVFKDLNNGKVKKYKGETKSWEGTYSLKYYTHHWVGKEGLEANDNYSEGQLVIHFKPKKSIKNIECEYKEGLTTLKTSVDNLDDKGNITLVLPNADVHDPSNPPTMTLKTDNKVETITFRKK